jgi:hypothetical protein
MAEYWEMLNFSGKESVGGAEPPYSPDNFQEARPNILMLRALAKAGREETSKMALETMGAKKVVWYEADGLDAVHGVTLTPAQSDKVSRTIFPDNGSPSVDVAREVIGPQVVNSADTSGSDYTLSGESNRQSPAPMDAAGEATSIKEGCPPSHSSSGSAVDIIASSERNGEMEESSEVEVEEAPRLLSTESSNKPASPTVPEPAVEVESTSVNSADQKASTTPAGGETLPLPESRYMAVSGDSLGDAARLLPFPQTDTLLPSGHEPAFCLTLIDDISGDIDSTLLSPSPAEHLSHRDLESTDATQASTLDAPCADLADAMATTDTSTAGSTMSAPGSEIHGEPVLKSSL